MKIVKNARNEDYQRAKREIDILKIMKSPYIVEYFDSYFATDEFYIVMKFYEVIDQLLFAFRNNLIHIMYAFRMAVFVI